MKQSKRTIRVLKHLDQLKDSLKFFMTSERFHKARLSVEEDSLTISESFVEIRKFIEDLSIDQKKHDTRLWLKFRGLANFKGKK